LKQIHKCIHFLIEPFWWKVDFWYNKKFLYGAESWTLKNRVWISFYQTRTSVCLSYWIKRRWWLLQSIVLDPFLSPSWSRAGKNFYISNLCNFFSTNLFHHLIRLLTNKLLLNHSNIKEAQSVGYYNSVSMILYLRACGQ